jgi:hypothetical protein
MRTVDFAVLLMRPTPIDIVRKELKRRKWSMSELHRQADFLIRAIAGTSAASYLPAILLAIAAPDASAPSMYPINA